MKHLALLLLFALSLSAADASGKWTGTIAPSGEEAHPAYLILKQDGEQLSGSGGPDASEQHPISKGKAQDGKLTFDINTEDGVMHFVLQQTGDALTGDVTLDKSDGSVQAKLEVKRSST